METTVKKISELKCNKEIDNSRVEAIIENFKMFGQKNPIPIDRDNNVIDGENRYMAYRKLGIKSVQCLKLTAEEMKLLLK